MKRNLIFLIVGVVLFTVGLCLNLRYEETSIVVQATVTDIDTKETSDGEYRHVYYGEYTVDGKIYENKKLTTQYSDSETPDELLVGDVIALRVSPDNPNRKMWEGGFLGAVGLVLTVWNAVVLYRRCKQAKALAEAPQ